MTLFGNGKRNSQTKSQALEQPQPRRTTLKDLVPNNDNLYVALQTFILGDPKRQLPLLGTTDSLLTKGDDEKAKGKNPQARFDYETAAKIELFKQNREAFEKFLRLANDMTAESEREKTILQTMLANMDAALRISKEYYQLTTS
jgi:hypothetical protein